MTTATARVIPLHEAATRKRVDLPTVDDARRPFHLYDAAAKKFLRYYFYLHKLRALRTALWLAKWMPVGATLEVIDVRTMRLHGQYTRRVNHVEFAGETVHALPKRGASHG